MRGISGQEYEPVPNVSHVHDVHDDLNNPPCTTVLSREEHWGQCMAFDMAANVGGERRLEAREARRKPSARPTG